MPCKNCTCGCYENTKEDIDRNLCRFGDKCRLNKKGRCRYIHDPIECEDCNELTLRGTRCPDCHAAITPCRIEKHEGQCEKPNCPFLHENNESEEDGSGSESEESSESESQ